MPKKPLNRPEAWPEAWIDELQSSAAKSFQRLGLPTVHDEEWRATNIAAIKTKAWQQALTLAPAQSHRELIAKLSMATQTFAELVFVDGTFVGTLSHLPEAGLPQGVQVTPLRQALTTKQPKLLEHFAKLGEIHKQPFLAWNLAEFQDGAFIYLPAGIKLSQPLHLLFLTSESKLAQASQPRNLIIADSGSSLDIVETYASISEHPYLNNTVTELVVADQAQVTHTKIQVESNFGLHIGRLQVHQTQSSRIVSNLIALGSELNRNDIEVVCDGERSECLLNGLTIGGSKQLIDNHTFIDHAKPNCHSFELYKGIFADQSQGVFRGKIMVRPDAQKIDAKQSNSNLLLSEAATINTKPQLEIFADDVKCTHGATIGRLDSDALFYLRSRGLSAEHARNLLIFAFASEVLEKIDSPIVREQVRKLVLSKLPQEAQLQGN